MGTRRYAKSGLGFLLAFALATTATPAAASVAGAPDAKQEHAVMQSAAGVEAAGAEASDAETSSAESSLGKSSKSAGATVSTVPGDSNPESAAPVESQPTSAPADSEQIAGQTPDANGGAAAPTETAPADTEPVDAGAVDAAPTVPAVKETVEPATEPSNVIAEPVAKDMEDESSRIEQRSVKDGDKGPSDITVKVYKMVTGLDGGIATAVPKAGWEFSADGPSLKFPDGDTSTTNAHGLAIISANVPGNSGKPKTVSVHESDPDLGDYELVQQYGKNAVCAAGGEPIEVTNDGNFGFEVDASPGEPVTCTVYNHPKPADLTLINEVKNGTAGSASAADWNLIATPDLTSSDTITNAGSAGGEEFEVAHGTYTLSQSDSPATYTWLSLKCSTDGKPAVNVRDFTVTLDAGTDTTCTFTNAYHGIDVEMRAWNVVDYIWAGNYPDSLLEFDDDAPVPFGTTMTWTYTVTNIGATTISGITVDDDKLATVACPTTRLKPGDSMVCAATGQLNS